MNDAWNPSSMESKCLQQLDATDNWRMLNRERPLENEVLSWKPFYRIFGFNFVLFLLVLSVLLSLIAVSSGFDARDLRENIITASATVGGIACAMSLYVTSLYRRVWNRRAKLLGGLFPEE